MATFDVAVMGGDFAMPTGKVVVVMGVIAAPKAAAGMSQTFSERAAWRGDLVETTAVAVVVVD